MPNNFNAQAAPNSLHEILRASDIAMSSYGGNLVAAKLIGEAHNEFCRLDTAQKTATIAELSKNHDMSILTNGYGTPLAAVGSVFDTRRGYISFDCSDKK